MGLIIVFAIVKAAADDEPFDGTYILCHRADLREVILTTCSKRLDLADLWEILTS